MKEQLNLFQISERVQFPGTPSQRNNTGDTHFHSVCRIYNIAQDMN
jgi:hypothetical protein